MQRMTAWLFGRARLDEPMPWWQRYGTALMIVAAAFGLRCLFEPVLEGRGIFGFFLIATAFVDWRVGLGPALLSLAIGSVLGCIAFEGPHKEWTFDPGPNGVPLVMSTLIGLVTVVVCESLRTLALENARLYREAKQSEIRKDDFLAMLAHELRNPLAPIRNALYILDMADRKDPAVTEMYGMMSSQVDHLVRLVDDLLDVARITRGKIDLRPTVTRLADVVSAAVAMARPLIDEKKHQLFVQLPQRPWKFTVDGDRLTQVLSNLLNNAAKYTDSAGRIWFTAEIEGEAVMFRVRDTGVGLTDEQIARVFQLFEQADSAVEKSRGGLGIGLTLARFIVDMHGGTLSVTSGGVGLGSEFTVRLPLAFPRPITEADEAKRELDADRDARADEPQARTARPLRILIVEDSVTAAQSLAAMLQLWGHQVVVCHDGFTGQEQARSYLPDVVLADLGMPQMSGYRLAEELRQIPQLLDTMLIAISGYGQARDRERSAAVGFTHHLTKPIVPQELKTILDGLSERTVDRVNA
jgi:two-component system CheB/CheR fusion protein